jgi:hypothetical protein
MVTIFRVAADGPPRPRTGCLVAQEDLERGLLRQQVIERAIGLHDIVNRTPLDAVGVRIGALGSWQLTGPPPFTEFPRCR